MRVAGLQPGVNDNAHARAIVFHAHPVVFWSGGCFVTPAAISDRLIDLTMGGTLVYVHRSSGGNGAAVRSRNRTHPGTHQPPGLQE